MATNNAINLTAQGVAYYNGTGTFSAPTLTQFGLVVGDSSNNVATLSVGATGTVLIGNTGGNPSFSASPSITSITLATPLVVSSGGTGSSSFNTNGVLISGATTTTALTSLTLTNGQIVIGATAGAPAAATLTAGSGVAITNGTNSITISSTGGGLTWTVVSGTTQSIAVNNGYTSNNAGLVTLTLPATAAVGDTIAVTGLGAGGWTIAQNASQLIHFGSAVTTTGTGGSLSSTNQYDAIQLTCVVANTTWITRSSVGNITYV